MSKVSSKPFNMDTKEQQEDLNKSNEDLYIVCK